MLIFAIDDEPKILRDTEQAIRGAAPEAKLMCFALAADALAAIRDKRLRPDIVFSEIEMPGLSGLDFAVALKTASPDTRVVFVTDIPKYALDAFRVRAQGYIMKPLTPYEVQAELDALPTADNRPKKLRVQCFGSFEVFWQGEPLKFSRRQTKELLAYLVDRKGASCTAEEIISALWGDVADMKNAKHRIRNFVGDLRETLRQIGMEDVLIRRGAHLAIRPEMLDCDYYRMLEDDMASVNTYRGEYMTNYSWAELTAGTLYFHNIS